MLSRRFEILRFEDRSRKLRFRDGLVWTVDLTVEIKLRFQLSFLRRVDRCLNKGN